MTQILVVGEKTSQVKKFVETLCGSYNSTKHGKYIYSYSGRSRLQSGINFTFLPLAGHISTIETNKGYNWGECPPIKLVYDAKALYIKNKRQYVTILRSLIKGMDELWLATDPDSEGDNIALEVVNILQKQLKKDSIPVKRVWNSSLTNAEIIRAFTTLRPWVDNLALGVQGRRYIDAWMGFAGTREITRAARKVATIKVLSIGRVQLPTLYLVVRRDIEHESFVPHDQWKIVASFEKSTKETYEGTHPMGMATDYTMVEAELARLTGTPTGTVLSIKDATKNTPPPHPLNTTAGVSLLSRLLKISANKALSVLEELYNQELLSYPRTENKRFQDGFPHQDILSKLAKFTQFVPFLKKLQTNKQVRNNGPKLGVEDHDPIHPTGEGKKLSKLDALHQKAWNIMVMYYISLFMDDLTISQQHILTRVKDVNFVTEGRRITQLGWREAQSWQQTKENPLPPLSVNEEVLVQQLKAPKSTTKPPPRLSDSQLIMMMERLNIGTKSSRPDIISKLVQRNYIQRKNRKYVSTAWGRTLIASLAPIWPDVVTPRFTADVEDTIDQVSRGTLSYNQMLDSLRQLYIGLHQDLLAQIPQYLQLLQRFNLQDQKQRVKIDDELNSIILKLFKIEEMKIDILLPR